MTAITKDNQDITIMSHLVGIGLVLGFLLPHTHTAFLLVNPLICIFYQCFKNNRIWCRENLIVIVPIFLSILVNFTQDIDQKSLLSCTTIILYLACFPIVGKTKIPNHYFYIILTAIVLTQLAYVIRNPFLIHFLDTYYPISEKETSIYDNMRNTITTNNITKFRLGGLYRNANHTSKYITFLLAAYIILNERKSLIKLCPFIIISFISVILTGSRTGFAVISIIIIATVLTNKNIPHIIRYGIPLMLSVAFIYIISTGSSNYRSFNIAEMGSSDAKVKTFISYLSSENTMSRLLFGYLDPTRYKDMAELNVMAAFDSDYGYIVFQYGFVGAISFLLYYYLLFRKTSSYRKIIYIVLLWILTSAVVTSFRAFFLFSMLLSIIYSGGSSTSSQHNNDLSYGTLS